MNITKEEKTAIIKEYARKEGDVGSPEVQIALLSSSIQSLTEHMRAHPKDNSTMRGLVTQVNRRRKLLKYLNSKNHAGYLALIKKLGLRH